MPTNRLAYEKSPYLLQHAHNPVDWYPWGPDAFAKAQAEDKPIFLSAGYSTCHWCHVMERESFENEAIAALLNRYFVSVKLDREERPDVDRIYMLFVQATTGSGGWPMSVFLTPTGAPFFGGTYFPPDSRYGRPGFASILEQIAEAWRSRRTQLLESSRNILDELRKHTTVVSNGARLDPSALDSAFFYYRRTFDKHYGGFGNAPKFPRPAVLNFLFRYSDWKVEEEALHMALTTLREMARGGMHDHLGGGFHRYSVDERWFVPHFEKMLYDQAQLAISYLEAFQITSDPQFASTARAIFEYVLRDMTHPLGGFFSAEDADSILDPAEPHEKGEGAFYIWTAAEIQELLGPERAAWVLHHYGCLPHGNVDHDPHGEFTGRNILYQAHSWEETARQFSIPSPEPALEECKRILLDARNRRPRPHLDDKILSGWNALMISAFAFGARVLHEPRYAEAARRATVFILEAMTDAQTGNLYRRWRQDEAAIDAFLDDYAAFVNALIDLYEATFDVSLLGHALQYALRMIELFEDREQGGFFSSTASGDLVLRLKEDYDGAEPAGNSLAIGALLRLAQYTGKSELANVAHEALEAFAPRLNQQPLTLPQMCCAWMATLRHPRQLVLTGTDATPFLDELRRHFLPNLTLIRLANSADEQAFSAWAPWTASMVPSAQNAAYLCENFACHLPVHRPEELRDLLRPASA
jgi:uncharacterized protein YyaL (SSP411 family)